MKKNQYQFDYQPVNCENLYLEMKENQVRNMSGKSSTYETAFLKAADVYE